MEDTRKLRLNTFTGMLNQTVTLLAGLILPRYILMHFGSEINGLTQSINQFLSIISFLELGVGAVVQSALYKPIANNDKNKINVILTSAKQFFNNLVKILIIYVLFLLIFLPLFVDSPFDYFGTSF